MSRASSCPRSCTRYRRPRRSPTKCCHNWVGRPRFEWRRPSHRWVSTRPRRWQRSQSSRRPPVRCLDCSRSRRPGMCCGCLQRQRRDHAVHRLAYLSNRRAAGFFRRRQKPAVLRPTRRSRSRSSRDGPCRTSLPADLRRYRSAFPDPIGFGGWLTRVGLSDTLICHAAIGRRCFFFPRAPADCPMVRARCRVILEFQLQLVLHHLFECGREIGGDFDE